MSEGVLSWFGCPFIYFLRCLESFLWFVRVLIVECFELLGRMLHVCGWLPRSVRVWVSLPLDEVFKFPFFHMRIHDGFYFKFFFIIDDVR